MVKNAGKAEEKRGESSGKGVETGKKRGGETMSRKLVKKMTPVVYTKSQKKAQRNLAEPWDEITQENIEDFPNGPPAQATDSPPIKKKKKKNHVTRDRNEKKKREEKMRKRLEEEEGSTSAANDASASN